MYVQPPKPQGHLFGIPSSSTGSTKATLKMMAAIVRAYAKNADVRGKAVELTRDLPSKDWLGEVKVLWDFVSNRVRYVRDILGTETVHTPDVLLQQMSGDCDDKAVLLASLLRSLGHPARFVALGFDGGPFSHVIAETLVGNNWIALETTEPVALGWSPPGATSRYVMDI